MKNISTSYSQQYNKKVSLLSQQTGKNGKSKVQHTVIIIGVILVVAYIL
jgi:hypothetical protein